MYLSSIFLIFSIPAFYTILPINILNNTQSIKFLPTLKLFQANKGKYSKSSKIPLAAVPKGVKEQ